LDLATLLGLGLATFGLVGCVAMEGGTLGMFINVPAFLIIFFGTLGATMMHVGMKSFLKIPVLLIKTIKTETSIDPQESIRYIVGLAEKARREGLLSLEGEVDKIENQFLKRGMQLVVDGTEQQLVNDILETELSNMRTRHSHGYAMFNAAGAYAPTLGIIGCVLGLINMLVKLSSGGEDLGHAVAVAFVATLYGIIAANLILLPIGGNLKGKSEEEIFLNKIVIEGILSIQAGDNPRVVEDKLKSFFARKPGDMAGAAEAA
jgi:chemotaxis protein MotA